MQLTFLGTACMMPTKERNHSSVFLCYGSEGILFDCGEGTQRQLRLAGIKPPKIRKILISHWHGDHVLGLPGLLQTLNASDYQGRLKLYGPRGSRGFFERMCQWFHFDRIPDTEVVEVGEGIIFEDEDYVLEAMELDHGVPVVGYRFVEKDRLRVRLDAVRKLGIPDGPLLGQLQDGKTVSWKGRKISPKDTTYAVKGKVIAYLTDTGLVKNCFLIAQDAEVLISEATFGKEHEEKAESYKHLTVEDAARIANQANVKRLVLTHFSQRYKDMTVLEEEAKTLFQNVLIAHDLMRLNV